VEFKTDHPQKQPERMRIDPDFRRFYLLPGCCSGNSQTARSPRAGQAYTCFAAITQLAWTEKGRLKVPRGIQRVIDRKIQHAILHHEFGRQGCPDISLSRSGNRSSRSWPVLSTFNPTKKTVPVPRELLGTAGGNRRPRPIADAAVAARVAAQIKGARSR